MFKCCWVVLLLVSASACTAVPKQEPTLSNTRLTDEQLEVYRAFLRSYSEEPEHGSLVHTRPERPLLASEWAHLNLANRTKPLGAIDGWTTAEKKSCLKGLRLDNKRQAETSFHLFDPTTVLPENVTLVDPEQQTALVRQNDPDRHMEERHSDDGDRVIRKAFASGLLTLSEVAFDKAHRYAVMSFSFYCGSFCAHGANLVFEKAEGKWVRSQRGCRRWVA